MKSRRRTVHAGPALLSKGYQESGLSPERLRDTMDAARSGNAQAAYELGCFYKVGAGVHRDLGMAAKWWTKAAGMGVAKAQVQLAILHHKGLGVSQNTEEAIRWYRAAADQEDTESQIYLGRLLWNGEGVRADREEAALWWSRAAATGHPQALWNMGIAHWHGWNGTRDRRQAVHLFRKAVADPDLAERTAVAGRPAAVRVMRIMYRLSLALGITATIATLYWLVSNSGL